MEMTAAQIRGAMMAHRHRLQALQAMGYPEDHPLVAWHIGHLARLQSAVFRNTEN